MSGLIKQIVDVLFNQGIDRKTDERLVVPGKLTRLDDAVFDSSNVIRRRNGYSSVTLTHVDGGAAVSGAKALHRVGDELLIENENGLHRSVLDYDRLDGTVDVQSANTSGVFRRAAARVQAVTASDSDQYEVDAAYGADLAVRVWVEAAAVAGGGASIPRIGWICTNERTGGTVLGRGFIESTSAAFYHPRVICTTNNSVESFEIYYVKDPLAAAPEICHRRLQSSGPTFLTSEHTISSTTVHANALFDASYNSSTDRLLLVYKDDAGGAGTRIQFNRLSSADGYTVASGPSLRNTTAEVTTIETLTADTGGVTYYHAFWTVSAGTSVLWESRSGDSLTGTLSGNVATTLANIGRLAAKVDPADTSKFFLVYEHNSASANLTLRLGARQMYVNGTGGVSAQVDTVVRGVGLAAKPYPYASVLWLPVALLSAVQPTMFVVNLTAQYTAQIGVPGTEVLPFVLAKLLPEEFGNLRARWAPSLRVPDTKLRGDYAAHIPCSRRARLTYYKTTDVTVSTIVDAVVEMGAVYDYAGTQNLSSCELNDLLFLAGSQPRFYDGSQWSEAGFNYFPEITAAATAAGSMTPSTSIAVTVVFEWYDAKGRRHQSAPAVPITVALSGAQGGVDLTVSTLRLTDKQISSIVGADPRGVRLVPYRTKSNGVIFYRTQATTTYLQQNNPTVDTLTLDLRDSDTDLASGELLYTTGNILEADAFEPCQIACTHQERLFMAGLQDPYEIRYTEQDLRVDRVGPSTNTVYTIRVPEVYGKITALASLDDKLVATCERGIYYFGGEGANRLGLQATFSPAICASSLFGHRVNEPGVLITTPDGLWFHAKDGFRFLNRGMQVQRNADGTFMGSEVDSYADAVCHRAVAAPAKRQVRFYMASAALVYDYQYGQWSRFTNQTNVDAAVNRDGNFCFLTTSALYEETASAYTDNGTVIAMLAETGWLKLAGLQGFERVYRVKVLGTFESTATLQLEVAYDYSSTYQTPVSMTTGSVFSATPVQAEHHLPKQKCEAVRFRITDTNTAAGGGTRSLIGLALQVGVKKGFFKTPSGQRM